MTTLEEAKKQLRKNFKAGQACPCCHQFVKAYKLQIHSTMARALLEFYHNAPHDRFTHVRNSNRFPILIKSGSFSKLAYWDLIQEERNDDTDKKRSGHWKLTQNGILFAEKQLKIKRYVWVYNGKMLPMQEDEQTDIVGCLGKKFSYSELMGH